LHQSNLFKRSSGILLHPTALPGKYGIGCLGKEALRFIDLLALCGQKLWQICPLGPTGYGDSPYQCFSSIAGNPMLIDPEELLVTELLQQEDLTELENLPEEKVDFGRLIPLKYRVLRKSYLNFIEGKRRVNSSLSTEAFKAFCRNNKEWLDDFALFMALKQYFGGRSWDLWDDDIRLRKPCAVRNYTEKLQVEIEFLSFLQYLFFYQWEGVKNYANNKGIKIIGDMPIFTAYDSVDLWINPELFLLDANLRPAFVAGVPPDYFSKTGQLWGNPLYNWEYLEKQGFSWWLQVLKAKLTMYDYLRIDHFRGFSSYWAVPFGENTAVKGWWRQAPGKMLFRKVREELGDVPIIAEDLGYITPDVEELIEYCRFPGMKVLQFAFDAKEQNDHLPHNFPKNCVVYTGTHDNDTTVGWFRSAEPPDREFALKYMNSRGKEVHWDFIRTALASTAVFSLFPMQDIMGLGSEARFNTPGIPNGNWQWRMKKGQITTMDITKLKELTRLYGR